MIYTMDLGVGSTLAGSDLALEDVLRLNVLCLATVATLRLGFAISSESEEYTPDSEEESIELLTSLQPSSLGSVCCTPTGGSLITNRSNSFASSGLHSCRYFQSSARRRG